MASELSNFIDDELKKMEEQPENQRLLSALRVKTSPSSKAKAGLAAAERPAEPRRYCGMAARTWLALLGGAALFVVVVALVAGARSPSSTLSSHLADLKTRMPVVPTLGNRKTTAPGGAGHAGAAADTDPAAAAVPGGAPTDPADAALEKAHDATETSEMVGPHLKDAVDEPPPGGKKHVGPGSGHKHKHKKYPESHHKHNQTASDEHSERGEGRHSGANPNPRPDSDPNVAAAMTPQRTQTDAAYEQMQRDKAAGAPLVAYGPKHIMTALPEDMAGAALAPATAAQDGSLAAEPAPAPGGAAGGAEAPGVP